MFSNSNNHNSALPVAVAADRGGPSDGGGSGGVPRVITVNSPTNENTCTSKSQLLPSVAMPTPKVRNGVARSAKTPIPASSLLGEDNRSLASASSGTTASSSHVASLSLGAASDGADTTSRASSTSFSVPRGRGGPQVRKARRAAQDAEAALVAQVQGVDTATATATMRFNENIKPNVSARPPRPTPTEQQRHQRQQMLSQSIAFQNGEDATTLCSSVADDSRNDQSSLGGSASAFSGASERDSITNSVGFSYEEDDDGHDDGTDDGYDGCGMFGIDEQAEDDFEKFYDDLSIDSQGRDGLDRERATRHKEKMKQMASGLRKRVGGKRKGRRNKNTVTAVVQDVCSPTAAKARLEMAYENYLHTYKFDTVHTPTASNKTHNTPESESRRIDRRKKRVKNGSPMVISDDNDDVAVATSTVPPFQGSATMDSSTGSSNGSSTDLHACPMCSSKLLNQHRRVFLDSVPAVPTDANVATATTMAARATNPRGHNNLSIQRCINTSSEGCLQCAEKCPDSVQPTVKSFLLNIFASSSTDHKDGDVNVNDNVTKGLVHPTNVEKNSRRDQNEMKKAHITSDIGYEERLVPPFCTECRAYIVTEATEAELREAMLANLSEWMIETNDEEDAEENEDNEFQIASLKLHEDGNVVVDRPLRGNILVFLDDEADAQVARSMQEMDEQSVTTRQQENLSSPQVPMLPTYPGLHLVSSGEVQARGREVLPPPPALPPSISEDQGDSLAKRAEVNVSPIFASQFGPPDASVPISDALNNTARPNKEEDTAEIIGGHAVTEVSSINQTPSIRTEKEEAEIITSYPTKRDIATNIIGAKLLNGYTLTHKQCSVCDMPMMERGGRCACVVCPTIKRKAKRRAKDKRKERKEIGSTVKTALTHGEAAENTVAITNCQEHETHIPRVNEGENARRVGDDAHEESVMRNIPTNGEVSKVIGGDILLELIEAPVPTYFDGLDTISDRLLNGWYLSSEREGCSNCDHPMICEKNHAESSGGMCINNSCRVVVADHSDSGTHSQAPGMQQSNNMSYDSADDDLFDLDDPALVALQKLACDKKDAAKESDRKASDNHDDTTGKESPDIMAQGGRSLDKASIAASEKNQRRQSFEHFTFDRQGLDGDQMQGDSMELTSRAGLGAEIHCDSLTSCSSLSFAGKMSRCSKKTCTTGIATSSSEYSDGTDDTMSALVEKMSKAKKRILRRLESRSTGLNNDKGRTGRDAVEYDVANLIDRLTVAAKEVEELDNCIAKAQEDHALDF